MFSNYANGKFDNFPPLPGVYVDAEKLLLLKKDSGFQTILRKNLTVDEMLEAIKAVDPQRPGTCTFMPTASLMISRIYLEYM